MSASPARNARHIAIDELSLNGRSHAPADTAAALAVKPHPITVPPAERPVWPGSIPSAHGCFKLPESQRVAMAVVITFGLQRSSLDMPPDGAVADLLKPVLIMAVSRLARRCLRL